MGQELPKAARVVECYSVARQVLSPTVEAIPPGKLEEQDGCGASRTARSSSRPSLSRTPVIVFDWDDTLMCTSAVNQRSVTAAALEELQLAVDSILHTAMVLGETMIVTNGNATWVHDSASSFLPRLLPTLAKVRVVSARALFEHSFPDDPYKWKQAAFEHLLVKERHATREVGLNLVALGDQMPEIEAAYEVLEDLQAPSCAKTLKFKERPSIQDLIGQLRRTERELSTIVAEETSGHRCLKRSNRLERSATPGSDSAAVWRLTDKTPDASSDLSSNMMLLALQDLWPIF